MSAATKKPKGRQMREPDVYPLEPDEYLRVLTTALEGLGERWKASHRGP
jgi:hypothetical protein